MNSPTIMPRIVCCFILCITLFGGGGKATAKTVEKPRKTEAQLKLEEKAREEKLTKRKKVVRGKISREEIAKLKLPRDTSPVMTVKELRISGNALITTEELLLNVPLVYNASDVPLQKAESMSLYDFRALPGIIDKPGQPGQVSARTIRGLTQYILSAYQDKGYAGIYVYVPSGVLKDNKLLNDILLINVTEAPVTSVTTAYYTPENERAEKGYLKDSALLEWSPVKQGQAANQKELDEMVNLLNLNPDRYISPVVSAGAERNTLALNYRIYEANPWHYFLQADNSGTSDRQWNPRLGLINTNLTGIDDKLTTFVQAPLESNMDDEYSVFASYDLPLMGPKLRLNLFAGRSEYDVEGGGGIDFIGNGSVYGGELRYNAYQKNGWLFDITTSLSREKSKVSSSIFNTILGSEVEMDLWGVGVDLHRRTDMANTSVALDYVESIGGSSQRRYFDTTTGTGARTNADRHFNIKYATANHSRYLDTNKIQRVTGSLRWIIPNERLVPAKMTTFGGMYSVRGYKENRIVADGGILGSVQYEYDLIRRDAVKGDSRSSSDKKYELKKLAPVAFFDIGRAKMEHSVAGEKGAEDLYSVGVGALVEVGKNFSGAIYYGYTLDSTVATDEGDGRIHISLMMRW